MKKYTREDIEKAFEAVYNNSPKSDSERIMKIYCYADENGHCGALEELQRIFKEELTKMSVILENGSNSSKD